MKKFLVGCLVILVLGGILFGVGAYFLYRAASPVIQNARNYLENMSQLGELEKEIAIKGEYAGPASNELTEEQMQRFVRVQESVRTSLGQRMTEIEAKYKFLKSNADNNQPSVGETLSALSDMANLFIQARRFQVNALNQEKFSQSEYSWVRDRVFQAAGVEVTSMIDLKKIEEAVRAGTGVEDIRAPELRAREVPEKNRELVKPYLQRMDNWIPLAFFGL